MTMFAKGGQTVSHNVRRVSGEGNGLQRSI